MKQVKSILIFLMAIGLVTGCSAKTQTGSTDTTAPVKTEQAQETSTETADNNKATSSTDNKQSETGEESVTGRVSAVDGNTITVSVMPDREGQGSFRGGKRQGESSDTNEAEPPEGLGGQAPSKEGEGQGPANLEDSSNGEGWKGGDGKEIPREEKSFTISDATVITVKDADSSAEGSISDITTDSFVTISYTTTSDGTVTVSNVVVQTGQPQGGRPELGENSSSENK